MTVVLHGHVEDRKVNVGKCMSIGVGWGGHIRLNHFAKSLGPPEGVLSPGGFKIC